MSGRVVIAGGGITGLSTAYHLLREEPALDLLVVEKAERAGGNMGSDIVNGFVLEKGPNGFTDGVPATIDLARELGLGERLLASSPRAARRYVYKRSRLHEVPRGPLDLLVSPLLSPRAKLRLLAEPFTRRGNAEVEESVGGFGRRHFGREFTSTLLDPFVTGVYAGDIERLSLPSAFPRVAALEREHRSILRGILKRARRKRRPPEDPAERPRAAGGGLGGTVHFSFPKGLEELTAALAGRLGERLRLRTAVDRVTRKGPGFEVALRGGAVLPAAAFVSALPAPRAALLFSSWNPDLANALDEIPYAPVAVACLGYRREDVEHPLDGLGFLIPRDQGLRTLGALWVSSLFPPHAPGGAVSIRVLAGGAMDPEVVGWPEDDLHALVLAEMGPILGLRGEPIVRRIYRYPQGIPQYNVGHATRLRRIDGWLRSLPGLFLTGNAYRGVGINDCVEEGRRVAMSVLSFLRVLP